VPPLIGSNATSKLRLSRRYRRLLRQAATVRLM
jgi:hypothetical protein